MIYIIVLIVSAFSYRIMVIKLQTKFLSAVVACAAGTYGYYATNNQRKVYNSWTTNYTPSVSWDWNWDKRAASSLKKPSSRSLDCNNNEIVTEKPQEKPLTKACRHLILIRHGQYNLNGVTDEERSLSKLGQEQAALTGERLKNLSLPYNRFVHSTMTRATETANIIYKYLDDVENVETCDMLREGAPIPPEPPVGSWRPENHKFFTDGSRIEAAFRKYFYRAPESQTEDSYEIFVCHANVIRYFVCRGLQLPPEAWLRISLHNGSMTHMVINADGRVSLRSLGECGYMTPEKLSRT